MRRPTAHHSGRFDQQKNIGSLAMLLRYGAPRMGTAGSATVLSDAMAVLWFIHADAMYGFPAYELPVSDIIRKLGGEAYFKFLCRLDQAP